MATEPPSSPRSVVIPFRAKERRAPDIDAHTLERSAAGDEQAFGAIVHRYYRPALSVALKVVRNPNDARDIVQEAFSRISSNLSAFRGASNFYTWMHRIVTNLAIDHVRREGRAQKVMTERPIDDESQLIRVGELRDTEAVPSGPQNAVLRQELAERMKGAFASLSPDHQRILMLREVEGLSYEQISRVLRIPKGTVMSRLFHARQKMQALLAAYVDGRLEVAV